MSNQIKNTKKPRVLPEQMNRGGRRVIRVLINGLMHFLFRMEYVDKDKLLSEGPLLLIANHSSIFDIPVIHVYFEPWIYFVAKEELFRMKAANRFLRWWGAIPINREKTSLSSAREILARLQEKKIFSIIPEGTRVPAGSDYLDYLPKPGVLHFAKRSGATIQPVGIHGDFKFRGRVKVTVGDPFSFDELKTGPEGLRSDEEMVIEMMRRVYALNGVSYLADKDSGKKK